MIGKNRILGNLGWSVLSKISRQILQLAVIFLLSRILGPVEFGLMSMVTAFSMLAEIVRNMGVGASVIREKNESPELLNTAFCFNLVVGLCVYLLFFVFAPLISRFYNQPQLVDIVRTFSVIYIIGAFNIVQEALLQKRMEFRRLFIMDLASVAISGAVAVFMARSGWGVWSLVYQQIIMISISSVVLWSTSSWKPRLHFSRSVLKGIGGFSFRLVAHDIIYFLGRDADKFMIGKYLGAVVLGVYYRAFLLMLLPVNQINIVISRVMFPVLASLQDDVEKMKSVYLRATNMISYGAFPVLSLLFIIAEPLIILLLGEQWKATALYLRIFCIYGMLESVGTTIYWIYKAVGRADKMLRWGIISTALIIPAIVAGLLWNGAVGVAVSYVAIQLVLWIPGWRMAFRLIGLSMREMLSNIGPNFLNALLAMPASWMVYYFIGSAPPVIVVAAVSLVYCPVYYILSGITRQSGYIFLSRFIRRRAVS